jgi:hypothetical protein
MTKTLSLLLIGATLIGASPALAGNSADIVQSGGGLNTIDATQHGRDNDFGFDQDGDTNRANIKQRGKNNRAEGAQNGLDNDVQLDQRRGRRGRRG